MAESLSYSQVVSILSDRHDVDEESRTAFRGRLQHFQRLGFPAGTNTGRGRSASYGFGQLLMLALGVELIQVGLTPEKAVAILNANGFAVFQAVAATVEPEGDWFRKDNDIWLGFSPSAMSSAFDRNSGKSSEEDASFFFGGTSAIVDLLHNMQGSGFRRLTLIHLSGVLRHIGSYWVGYAETSQEHLIEVIHIWLEAQRNRYASADDEDEIDQVGNLRAAGEALDLNKRRGDKA